MYIYILHNTSIAYVDIHVIYDSVQFYDVHGYNVLVYIIYIYLLNISYDISMGVAFYSFKIVSI